MVKMLGGYLLSVVAIFSIWAVAVTLPKAFMKTLWYYKDRPEYFEGILIVKIPILFLVILEEQVIQRQDKVPTTYTGARYIYESPYKIYRKEGTEEASSENE